MLNAPSEIAAIVAALAPQLAGFDLALQARHYDIILFWPQTLDGLVERFLELQRRLQAASLLTDLVDNKTATVSEQDYATRFVIRKEPRAKYR